MGFTCPHRFIVVRSEEEGLHEQERFGWLGRSLKTMRLMSLPVTRETFQSHEQVHAYLVEEGLISERGSS